MAPRASKPTGQKRPERKQKAPQHRRQRKNNRQRVHPQTSLLGHFGASVVGSDLATMYRAGGNGSVNTKHELGLAVVDYFDYQSAVASAGNISQYVHNYYWDANQNLFDTFPTQPGGADLTFCRVRKLEVWVMPQCRGPITSGTADVFTTNAQQMYTVNAQVPGVTLSRDATLDVTALALNTQVTNCLPTINPRWKKVLSCDLQKTFESGVVRPFYAKGTPPTYSNQCLFSMSIVDPVTGKPYQSGSTEQPDPNIRVKVKLWIDQPIGTLNRAKFGIFKNEDFALPAVGQNGPSFTNTVASYAQIDLLRAQDLLR